MQNYRQSVLWGATVKGEGLGGPTGWPPKAATAPSVLTLVRVDLLLKVKATVLPANAPNNDFGIEPDFIACLCEWAFRIRVANSVLERSAILSRCLGANGEVAGE